MASTTITGKIVFQNIGTGFWGIEEETGKKWRPINLPIHLRKEGILITADIEIVKEDFDMFMWGKAVKLLSVH